MSDLFLTPEEGAKLFTCCASIFCVLLLGTIALIALLLTGHIH